MKKEIKYWKRLNNGERSPEFENLEELKAWLAEHDSKVAKCSSCTQPPYPDSKLVSLMHQAKEMEKKETGKWYQEVTNSTGTRIVRFLESPSFCNGDNLKTHYVKFDHMWIECGEIEYLETKSDKETKSFFDFNKEPDSFKKKDKNDEMKTFLSNLSSEQDKAFEKGFKYDTDRLNRYLESNGVIIEEPIVTIIDGKKYTSRNVIPIAQRIDLYIYLSNK